MKKTAQFPISRFTDNKEELINDTVVREYSLALIINERHFVNLLCTPEKLEALVYGYLLSEGIIAGKDDVTALLIDEEKGTADITVSRDIFPSGDSLAPTTTGLGLQQSIAYQKTKLNRLPDVLKLRIEQIIHGANAFSTASQLFIETGGVHSSALYIGDQQIIFCEDIGRYNSFDKVIGEALLRDIELNKAWLLTSCRIPGYMVEKVVRAAIPIIVSHSAPTDKAIELAKEYNLTLAGFARGNRFNLYHGKNRISL